MMEPGPWPPRPYKGLAKYSHRDGPLFVGREEEVGVCAARLLPSHLSLFVLHGLSGSGKSSFLRAGLLPYLERLPNGRYLSAGDAGIPVVRAGANPLASLAGAIWDISAAMSGDFLSERKYAAAQRSARLGQRSREDFIARAGASAEHAYRSLEALGGALARKVLLVVDQAEDVFSDRQEISRAQEQFFQLLSLLSNVRMPLDLKLLISMRSEFKARFDEQLSSRDVETSAVDGYYLRPVGPDGIIQAILRPTRREPVQWYGQTLPPPYDHYRFEYQHGLAEVIRRDLLERADPSSWLPVLQVICDRLFTNRRQDSARRITIEDYRLSGACNAQISSHVEEKIVGFLGPRESSGVSLAGQSDKWKLLLSDLTETQLDGKVRACLGLRESALVAAASRDRCLEPEGMLEWLSRPENYILERGEGVPGDPEPRWRLLHDSIAAALVRWRDHEGVLRGRSIGDSDPLLETDALDYVLRPEASATAFSSVNDLIWDHLLMLYARKRGFGRRLGIEIEPDPRFDLTKTRTMDYEGFLQHRGDSQPRLIVAPPALLPAIASEPWSMIGVTNVYRGYAILGAEHPGVEPVRQAHDGTGPQSDVVQTERLRRLASALADQEIQIGVFEERSRDFVQFILAGFGLERDSQSIRVIAPDGQRYASNRDPVFTALVAGEIKFALGSAPCRALAEQAGYLVYADFEDVHKLTGDDRRPELERLLMHEVLAVNLAGAPRPVLLRLISTMFYTVDYIRRNPEDFIGFIHDQMLLSLSDNGYWLQRRYIRRAVESCYSFGASRDYAFRYLDANSKIYFDLNRAGGPRLYLDLYQEWAGYRAECDRLLSKLLPYTPMIWPKETQDAFDMGERYYRIYDYYDAYTQFKRAADLLSPG